MSLDSDNLICPVSQSQRVSTTCKTHSVWQTWYMYTLHG